MLVSVVFVLLLLPCAGVLTLLLVYLWSFCYLAKHHVGEDAGVWQGVEEAAKESGLSAAQLEKLPRIKGGDLVLVNDECAVCLDDIEMNQLVRVVPGCNHAFHLHCGDAWLSKNSVCPLCRNKIGPELLDPPEESPC